MACKSQDNISDYSDSDDEDMDAYYYDEPENLELEQIKDEDPEAFAYDLLEVESVDKLLNESVETVSTAVKISPALAKGLLHNQKWGVQDVISQFQQNPEQLLKDCQLAPSNRASASQETYTATCPVCFGGSSHRQAFTGLGCGHMFCKDCWNRYLEIQINQGVATALECMGKDCNLLVPEDFIAATVSSPRIRQKYEKFMFRDFVNCHPELRFCPGVDCNVIIRAAESKPKRVICKCKATFCFQCSLSYHAPTQCDVIKRWLTKCADDSETANYISAHTKDCPKCNVCIEKNGGCNHMQCFKCKHDFCWVCLGDWKAHGSEYYDCSRYKENPNIVNEGAQAQAREALKKYLFYFERWENHAKSLRLEEQTLQKIRDRINENVMKNNGTWIDWQHLLDAAALLQKCRYTLQYTYPYAYYDTSTRKQWFEDEQAQLEVAVENLSWMVEHAEIELRGELEHRMAIVEKRRKTILRCDESLPT